MPEGDYKTVKSIFKMQACQRSKLQEVEPGNVFF